MDFSEFLRRIGAEPRSRDADLRAARDQDPRFAAAAAEAEQFETRLEKALRLPVDEAALATELLDNAFATEPADAEVKPRRRGPWPWLAMAAALVLTVGLVTVLEFRHPGAGSGTVEEYVRDHFRHDGPELLARAERGLRGEPVSEIFGALGAEAGSDLAERIVYIKFCPTLHGRGAHMVVRGADGPVTVFFMPDTELTAPQRVRFDDMAADLLALASGSAAIIGSSEGDESELAGLLLASIQPLARVSGEI